MRYSHLATGIAVAVAALCLDPEARAQTTTCSFTGTVVYAAGSSAQTPYLAALSQVLAAETPPVTLVYFQSASCSGVTDITTSQALNSSAFYWTSGDGGVPVENTCTPATPVLIDVGVSDVYASTCEGASVPKTQQEYSGPVQAMTFVVNVSSKENAISEEAAHVVFNDVNTKYTVAPWTNPAQLYTRTGGPTGSGTLFMIGSAIGVTNWPGTTSGVNIETSSGAVLGGVAGPMAAANPDESLGILSVTNTDPNRKGSMSSTPVKELAFQAAGQSCGYLPDSTNAAFDKLNVREGRYVIWGPGHYISAISGGKPVSTSNPGDAPTNTAVQKFIDLVTLSTRLSDTEAMSSIAAAAQADLISDCAMRVQRSGEVTVHPVEYSYAPPEGSCGCYWESQVSGATTSDCHTCTSSATCMSSYPATPVCRYGYCEAF